MKQTDAGRLRHWLTFQTLVTDQDSDGATVEEWVDAFAINSRMPCEITNLTGRELLASAALQSRCTHRIRVRYRAGFNAVQRALAPDGTTFNIEAVLPDDDSRIRMVTLLASSGINAGGTAT